MAIDLSQTRSAIVASLDRALADLASRAGDGAELALALAVSALQGPHFSDVGVARAACAVLAQPVAAEMLIPSYATTNQLLSAGSLLPLLSAALDHRADVQVCELATAAVRLLASGAAVGTQSVQATLAAVGTVDILGMVLSAHTSNAAICDNVLFTLGRVALMNSNEQAKFPQIVRLSLQVLRVHADSAAVACTATCVLSYVLIGFGEVAEGLAPEGLSASGAEYAEDSAVGAIVPMLFAAARAHAAAHTIIGENVLRCLSSIAFAGNANKNKLIGLGVVPFTLELIQLRGIAGFQGYPRQLLKIVAEGCAARAALIEPTLQDLEKEKAARCIVA